MNRRRASVLLVILALAACLALVLVLTRRQESFGDAKDAKDTIFVSVASYRDVQCADTVRDLFDKADDPTRVFIGLCEQNSDDASESCVAPMLPKNVRRILIPHTDAKGPVYARYLCSTLYQGETWFMQIDSHTKMAKGWDTLAISNATQCPSDKPILTHYPRIIEELDQGHTGVPVLCRSTFDGHGVPTFESVIMDPRDDGEARPVPFVSGGFVFGPGSLVHEVPYDPHLPYLFQGEEILHSARLWTSGYDFFTPLDNIAFHQYERPGPRFWNDLPNYEEEQQRTMAKVRRLLGFEGPPMDGYRYGMGSHRSMDAYWKFAGIDPHKKSSMSERKFCV